ncbi:MAG: sugar ABC transporter substrate-binding protein [Planctomycetaceae bacterium]|nr:sugar ABC transporter substrate-binding protein [Planctomycetaceae bacterium]
MRKGLTLVMAPCIAALFVLTFAYQAVAGEVTASNFKVGVIMKSFDEFQNAVIEGAEAACRELGLEIMATAPDAETEAARQVEMIEDMVTGGVNVLLIAPTLLDTVSEPLTRAIDKGMKVIFVDFSDHSAFPAMLFAIGTGNYNAAETMAKHYLTYFDDPKNSSVAIVRGLLGAENHNQRTQGFVDVMEAAGVTILDIQDAGNSADRAATLVENWMQKYGVDGLNAIIATSDSQALGVMSAVINAGALGKVMTQGFDGNTAIIEAVRDGQMTFTGAQRPYKIGYDAVMLARDYLSGKKLDTYYDTGVDIITKENANDFLK